MKRVLKGLFGLALVVALASFAASALPAAAVGPEQPTTRVIVVGGPPDAIISVSQAAGAAAPESSGAPTGLVESVTTVSPTGQTEVFVPVGTKSNVFIWSPSKGYTFLGSVAPDAAGAPVTLNAR